MAANTLALETFVMHKPKARSIYSSLFYRLLTNGTLTQRNVAWVNISSNGVNWLKFTYGRHCLWKERPNAWTTIPSCINFQHPLHFGFSLKQSPQLNFPSFTRLWVHHSPTYSLHLCCRLRRTAPNRWSKRSKFCDTLHQQPVWQYHWWACHNLCKCSCFFFCWSVASNCYITSIYYGLLPTSCCRMGKPSLPYCSMNMDISLKPKRGTLKLYAHACDHWGHFYEW